MKTVLELDEEISQPERFKMKTIDKLDKNKKTGLTVRELASSIDTHQLLIRKTLDILEAEGKVFWKMIMRRNDRCPNKVYFKK